MQTQLKIIHSDQSKETSARSQTATDELQYLMKFNQSISLAMAMAMQHLSDFAFVTMQGQIQALSKVGVHIRLRGGAHQTYHN